MPRRPIQYLILAGFLAVVAYLLVVPTLRRIRHAGDLIIPIGKDTSFVDGPLDRYGYVDYEAAVNDRLKGDSTPDTNAVVLLLKAFGPKPEGSALPSEFWQSLGIEPPPSDGEYFIAERTFFADECAEEERWEEHSDALARLRAGPWTATDAPKVARWLAANEKPFARIAEASKRKDWFHPVIRSRSNGKPQTLALGGLSPIDDKCRALGWVLRLRVTLRLGEGKFAEAWADVMTIHRLGRLVARGFGYQMGVGFGLGGQAHAAELAYIRAVKPDAKAALACQADLHALPPWPKYADVVDGVERLANLDALQSVPRNGENDIGACKELDNLPPERWGEAVDWAAMMRMLNRETDRLAAALRLPTRAERGKAFRLVHGEIEAGFGPEARANNPPARAGSDEGRVQVGERLANFVVVIFAARSTSLSAADRAEQVAANGLLAFALAAYVADRKAYPERLADLAPKYVAAVPDDVFSAKPLVYRRTDGGVQFYSLGINGQDDDGRSTDDDPKGDDLVVRLGK